MRIDVDRISALVAELELAPPERRLDMLRTTVLEHGGRWDLPSDKPGVYQPALMSLQVFGVFAAAEDLEELPRNWMRAAVNILRAIEEEAA